MQITKYCPHCQKMINSSKNLAFCENCGNKLQIVTIESPPTDQSFGKTATEVGKQIGNKAYQSATTATNILKKTCQNHQNNKRQTKTHENNYSELDTVFKSLQNIGRWIVNISKTLTVIFFIIGILACLFNIGKNPTIAFLMLFFPIFPCFILCLPIYIAGLVFTALPQIVLVIKECGVYLKKIYLKTENITEKLDKIIQHTSQT